MSAQVEIFENKLKPILDQVETMYFPWTLNEIERGLSNWREIAFNAQVRGEVPLESQALLASRFRDNIYLSQRVEQVITKEEMKHGLRIKRARNE